MCAAEEGHSADTVACEVDEDGGVCGLESCPRCGAPPPVDEQEILDLVVGRTVIDAGFEGDLVAFKFDDGTTLEIGWWANDMHDGGGVTVEMGAEHSDGLDDKK